MSKLKELYKNIVAKPSHIIIAGVIVTLVGCIVESCIPVICPQGIQIVGVGILVVGIVKHFKSKRT